MWEPEKAYFSVYGGSKEGEGLIRSQALLINQALVTPYRGAFPIVLNHLTYRPVAFSPADY